MLSRRQLWPALASPLLAQPRKPNLILIVTDDHHWQALGAAGNPQIQTPHLDRLAARGVNFTQGVVSTSQCAPSRGILLSGQECYETGLDCNEHTGFRTFTGATVVEQLRRGGYQTNLVGKWHIAPAPKDCGFTQAPLWLKAGASRYRNPQLRHGLDAPADTETPGLITELFTNAAVDVIRQATGPYLLWLAYNAPHTPWTASERYRALYRGKNAGLAPPRHPKAVGKAEGKAFDWETYYAVISELDAHIGRVVEAVEQSGQWDNTLVLVMGDNGYLCGSKGLDGKVHAWEESVRIPFLAAGGLVRARGKSDSPVASIDVPATLLDYARVKPAHRLSGLSLRGVLDGKRFAREAAFSSWNDGRPEALTIHVAVEPYRLVRTAAHKYIVWESKKDALFDLAADPFEEKNLAADPQHAALRERLRAALRARMKETRDAALRWL